MKIGDKIFFDIEGSPLWILKAKLVKNARFQKDENHPKSKYERMGKKYVIFLIKIHYSRSFQALSMRGTAPGGTLNIPYFGHFSSKTAKIHILLMARETSKITFHIKKT